MRAMVVKQAHAKIEPEDRPIPEPGQGEALIKVEAVGAGLTLENVRAGQMGATFPRVMGHEFAGTIERLGTDADVAGLNWKVGDRVTGFGWLSCRRCRWCVSGREEVCPHTKGLIGAATDGGFAEYMTAPAVNLVRVPDNVSLRDSCIVADAIATAVHVCLDRAQIKPAERVAIIGAGGGVGVHMVSVAKTFGAVVIAVEASPARLEALKSLKGVDAVVDSSKESWGEKVKSACDGQVDVVIDIVARQETLDVGANMLGYLGRLVIVGIAQADAKGNVVEMVTKEATITASRYATRQHLVQGLDMISRGQVELLIGKVFPLEQAEAAFAALKDGRVLGRIILDCSPDRSKTAFSTEAQEAAHV